MLCNKCQIREATVHFKICSGPAIEEPKIIELCQECFEASNLEEKHLLPTDLADALQAGCRFCGGEFYSGGLDPLALLDGIRKLNILCKLCAEEYFGVLKRKFPNFGDPDLTKEQSAILAANLKAGNFPSILAELEKHMKQWVAKRKSQ